MKEFFWFAIWKAVMWEIFSNGLHRILFRKIVWEIWAYNVKESLTAQQYKKQSS